MATPNVRGYSFEREKIGDKQFRRAEGKAYACAAEESCDFGDCITVGALVVPYLWAILSKLELVR